MLVDFGLVRQFCSRLTDPRALLGSLEFMAPEQSYDPSGVGKEADIYGLGATLFWLLTGQAPYPFQRHVGAAVRMLQRDPPRRLREFRPDAPAELDDLFAPMLAREPRDRPPMPLAVTTALLPYTKGQRVPDFSENELVAQVREVNRQLEKTVAARTADLRHAHDALLFAMAKMAESRDGETAGHLRRMQKYVRVLAEEARQETPWDGLVDPHFLEQLERCVPLHDIGKIGLPGDILSKPGSLSVAERQLVETHPLIGDRILESLSREHGDSLDFLSM